MQKQKRKRKKRQAYPLEFAPEIDSGKFWDFSETSKIIFDSFRVKTRVILPLWESRLNQLSNWSRKPSTIFLLKW